MKIKNIKLYILGSDGKISTFDLGVPGTKLKSLPPKTKNTVILAAVPEYEQNT